MKISKLGAALTLAAIASLGARSASAQVDMAGTNGALSSIRALKAAQAKAPKPSKKDVPAPTADDAAWHKILDLVKAKGKYTPEQPPIKPGMFSIEDVIGDANADHRVEQVSVMGGLNDDELFEVIMVGFSSTEWKKQADGNWHVDQWVFETNVYGEVAGVVHIIGVMTPDHQPVSGAPDKLTPADPRIVPKYKTVIDHWSAPRP